MKKLYSLIKASMTSDMNLFKIKLKKNSKISKLIPLFIAFYLMFMIWGSVNTIYEKLTPMNLQFIVLSIFTFSISLMTIVEGIYKSSSLLFNCRDDDLLFSLPIKKRTILFVRILKFYIFELVFNSLFLLPVIISYIRWAEKIECIYFLTSTIMLIMLPIIPIVISCIIGAIISSLSSKFKYKNLTQIIISMIFILGIMYLSYNIENIFNYLVNHATSINDLITKIYYPAGVYAKLVTSFNIIDLIIFVLINISVFVISIFLLSKFYFKINSRLKKVATSKKTSTKFLNIKLRSKNEALIRKELNTFFKTPVFIINAGFALVLFIVLVIIISIKFDSVLSLIISNDSGFGLSKNIIMNNLPILIFVLISSASYMTSITNSLISLEGKNINILKSLPVSVKTILLSKIYSCMILTTPILLIGDIILFIKFKISIIESILLIVLSILIPLVSHFIGLIINLKYPKLDAENSSEVVKQSVSSFMSVIIGMILLIATVLIITKIIGVIESSLILASATLLYLIIDFILYLYLTKKSVKDFNDLSI